MRPRSLPTLPAPVHAQNDEVAVLRSDLNELRGTVQAQQFQIQALVEAVKRSVHALAEKDSGFRNK